jgi:hypothetical protein
MQMKLLSKIAIVMGFIAFASSCEKERNITPVECTTQDVNSAGQRNFNPTFTDDNSGSTLLNGETEETSSDEDGVVGGGDDDRDGGDSGKKPKKSGS